MRPADELSTEVGTVVTELEDPLGEDPPPWVGRGQPDGRRCAQRRRHSGGVDRPRERIGSARGPGRDARGWAAMSLSWWLYLSSLLFAIGASAVLVRRNAIIVFMGVELMLNATNLAFVTFARMQGNLDGQVIALFVMLVAAAEVVVGLAIIMTIFRTRRSASVDDANLLKY